MNDPQSIARQLLTGLAADDFAGYDPFDMLNSRLFQTLPLARSPVARLALIQFGKHSPLNVRRLLAVPRLRNPKGIALCILGMLEDHARTDDDQLLTDATMLADWLLTQQSDRERWDHACWAYHFDWQARAFFVPRGKPNIITTCYIAMALFSLGQRLDRNDYIDVAIDTAYFMSKHLFISRNNASYFCYIPDEMAFVHNANLWGAAWCGKVASITGENLLMERALEAAQQSVVDQNESGAWRYGTASHHSFVDGFHTGYNLEALQMLAHAANTNHFNSSISKGYRYYVDHFFEHDGLPKYYASSRYPLDMHSAAQAIITMIEVGGTRDDFKLCDLVVNWSISNMYSPRTGRFVYQKTKYWTNNINYVRWTQSWSYYSLAFYNHRRMKTDATD